MSTSRTLRLAFGLLVPALLRLLSASRADEPRLRVEQVMFGPGHHFFGYTGHAGTTPWNETGRYIVALWTSFHDHMPESAEATGIVLIDTQREKQVRAVAATSVWNFQQGTMLFWNLARPESRFFFNDRDPQTNQVVCVLFDVDSGRRVREFRFADTPIGNSRVSRSEH